MLAAGFALAQDQDPQARLAAIGDRQTALETQAGAARNRDARLLTALLMFRRDPPPPLIADPKDALRAVDAAILIKAMTPALAAQAKGLTDQQVQLALLRRQAAAAAADAMTRESQDAEDGAQDQAAAPSLSIPVSSDAVAPPGAPALAAPVSGTLARGYGADQPGLMFEAKSGARVFSPASGRVAYVGAAGGGSLVIIIELAGDYRLVLSGLQKAQVSVGQQVAAGATLGALPQSSPDLYLELRSGERPVDPSALLR